MPKMLLESEIQMIDEMIHSGKNAMKSIEDWSQEELDNLAQSIGWFTSNEKTFTKLAQMGVDESGIGDRNGRPNKRFKIHGVLRDTLRQPTTGIIEEDIEKGLTKYAKPAGIIASLIPMTNPALTPPVTGIYSSNTRNSVIFSPHPRTAGTTNEMINVMRLACEKVGAPKDLFQCIKKPSIPVTQYLMSKVDLTLATGGKPMVQSAYSSGKPAYGVGAGNSSIVIDETADIDIAAKNTHLSKVSDFGSGCSADGNIIIQKSIYSEMIKALTLEGGYLCNENEKELLLKSMWDEKGNRTFNTIACSPQQLASESGFNIPSDRKFLMVENQNQIGLEHKFSKEKLTTLMSLYHYEDFSDALEIVRKLYETAGKGHSCGIYSHNDEHIDALARVAPVSRMMVRQPQSKANAGSFTNGMPMTSSLGCGIWGGNITNENVTLKHMMNYTWVSRPIAEDRPPESELFGKFYGADI